MKRVLTFLAVMLLPLSVMAMTPVSDSTLSGVTGQAGVNINANLTMNVTIGTMAWGDSDGVVLENAAVTTATDGARLYSGGGFVGVNNFNLTNLTIKARTETADNYGGYSAFSSNPMDARLKPITIDVATDTASALIGGTNLHGGATFVRIGLGSLQISMDDLSFDVALGSYAEEPTLNDIMGKVFVGGINMYISPKSYVDIFAHGDSGVSIYMDVIIDHIALTAVSWGDSDGLGTTSTAIPTGTGEFWFGDASQTGIGYVGIANIHLGSIYVKGQVNIDVASISDPNNSVYLEHYRELVALVVSSSPTYSWAQAQAMANVLVPNLTIVRITFGDGANDFTFGLDDYFRATVKLSQNANLSTMTAFGAAKGDTLGDIYLSNMQVSIKNGSWVDIWAH